MPRSVAIAGAVWIALCVASAAWSERRAYTLGEIYPELGYGALAFIVFNIGARDGRDLRLAAQVLLAGAVLLGIFVWIAAFFPGLYYAPRYHAIEGYFSTQLVMVFPMLAVAAWPRPDGLDWRWRTVALAVIALVAAGLATENRMLWIALAVGAAAAFATAARGPARATIARIRTALPLVLGAIALAAAASAEYKAQRYYPHHTDAIEAVALDERPLIWEAAGRTFVERPWLGHGFGRTIVGDTMARRIVELGSAHPFDHGHNVFIDMALQVGIVGLAAFVALLASIAVVYVRAAMRPSSVLPGVVGIAVLAGFVTKNMTDDFLYRPDSLVFWALMGLLLRLCADRDART